ncbi:MAG: hypothetical protein POELPBGB_01495 [Bacteroidia bacterium]|nr:hypothetical protein [Bacteroidia bacterium]
MLRKYKYSGANVYAATLCFKENLGLFHHFLNIKNTAATISPKDTK